MAIQTFPKVLAWSPSRLEKYEQCPRLAIYSIMKLCPVCFKGTISGGYKPGTVARCGTCGKTPPPIPPIERGTEIGATLENYVKGTASRVHTEVRHPEVLKIAKDLRMLRKKRPGSVEAEIQVVLDSNWNPLPTDRFMPNAWFRGKLDIRVVDGELVKVLDWKSGGTNKQTGEVVVEAKYDDQLSIYNLISLLILPTVEKAEASLVFVDTGTIFRREGKGWVPSGQYNHALQPVIARPELNLKRVGIPREQKKWIKKTKALLSDTIFAPRPNGKCGYCDFGCKKGGPCPN
jgi:hypothetical protein